MSDAIPIRKRGNTSAQYSSYSYDAHDQQYSHQPYQSQEGYSGRSSSRGHSRNPSNKNGSKQTSALQGYDYYDRENCPATPHNMSSELMSWNQEDDSKPYNFFAGTAEELEQLQSYDIDPFGYGSNVNRVQEMWRPHSL